MLGGRLKSHLSGTPDAETEPGTFCENNFHGFNPKRRLSALTIFGDHCEHAFEDLSDVQIRGIYDNGIIGLS
jgi:hypothetical protein